MYRWCLCVVSLMLVGCSTDQLNGEGSLADILEGREYVLDNVIACAASNKDDALVSVFFYPREGVSNLRYYETEGIEVDKNDYEGYVPMTFPLHEVFNGYLKRFEVLADQEKWVIVSFDEGGKIHLSNPIRLKHRSKPTEYIPESIAIDASTSMPIFSWQDGTYDDTKIYFQVISDSRNNLLSGTYTFDKTFQYYELDNVVLNITKDMPPALKVDDPYVFTLMGVSEDNWVNQFSIVDFGIN